MNKLLNHFKGDGLKAQLLKGATGTAGLKAINIVLTLAVGVLLARTLGPENYGIYAFVLSVITLLGLPTKAGLPTLIVRETAKYQLEEKWSNLRGLLTLSNTFVIFFSIFLAVTTAAFVLWLWGEEQSIKVSSLIWALLLLPLIAFGNIRGATLRGLRKAVQGQVPEQLVRPIVMLVLLGSTIIFIDEMISPVKAIQFNVAASLIAFMVGALLLSRSIPVQVKATNPVYETKVWAKALAPLSMIAGILIINGEVGLILLGFFAAPEDVGFYRIALSVAALVSLTNSIFTPIMEPLVARLFRSKDFDRLEAMLKIAARLSAACALVFIIAFYFFGEIFLKIIFGNDYVPTWLAILILVLGNLVGLSVGIAGIVLKQIHQEGVVLKSSIFALCVNLALSFVLIPIFGLNGAAASFAISFALHSIYKGIFLYRVSGINSSIV